jgi:hypothetical protein
MSEMMEMRLDMSSVEVLVVAILANMGSSLLSGDHDSVRELGEMLMRDPDTVKIAVSALDKLEASVLLAKSMTQGSEGLS